MLSALGAVLALPRRLPASESAAWVRVRARGPCPCSRWPATSRFSRGAFGAPSPASSLYAVAARPRGLPVALLTAGPPAARRSRAGYGAEALATERTPGRRAPTRAGTSRSCSASRSRPRACCARSGCSLRRAAGALPPSRRRRAARHGWPPALAGGMGSGAAVAIAARRPARRPSTTLRGSALSGLGTARALLRPATTGGSTSGAWRATCSGRAAARARRRHVPAVVGARAARGHSQVVDGHSLYLEMLGRARAGRAPCCSPAVLLALLGRRCARLRGPDRHGQRGPARAPAWRCSLHAGIDWDWEMPALCLWLFAAGGARSRRGRSRAAATGRRACAGDRRRSVPAARDHPGAAHAARRRALDEAVRRSSAATAARHGRRARPASTRCTVRRSRSRCSATATCAAGRPRSRSTRWRPRAAATRATGGTPTGSASRGRCGAGPAAAIARDAAAEPARAAGARPGPRAARQPSARRSGAGPPRARRSRRLEWAVDRARRGGSGALHPQSALAGLNPSRGVRPSGQRAGPRRRWPGPARCRSANQVRSGRKQP